MKSKLMISWTVVFGAVVAFIATAQQYNMTIAYTDAPRITVGNEKLINGTVAAVYAFEDTMNTLSGGKFHVDFKTGGVLGGQVQTINEVQSGVIEATTPALPALASFYPNIQVLSIPYLFPNPVVAWKVLDGSFGTDLFSDMAKTTGLRIIAVYDNGGYRNFSNNKRPIHSVADMHGLKIRVIQSPAQLAIVRSMGASATPIPWVDLYTALQTGVVDGEENSPTTLLAGSLEEVQKYYTIDQHTLSLAAIVASEQWYESLPPQIQKDVTIAGQVASVAGRGTSWTDDELALKYIEKRGVQVYFPTAAQRQTFKDSAQQPVISWMRNNSKIDNKWVDMILNAVSNAKQSLGIN